MRTGSRARSAGAAYLLLLVVVALLGVAAAGSVQLGATASRRDAERELVQVGLEFQRALRRYAALGGSGPESLDDLVADRRGPQVRRHLRRVYADPLTGSFEWGLVRDARNRIVGIHSLAAGTPIQQALFPVELAAFEGASSYREWIFGLAVPATAPASAAQRMQR